MRKFLWAASLIALSACGGIEARTEDANALAQTSHLTQNTIITVPFVLTTWSRVNNPGEPINLYIEGDGLAWMSRSEPSLNPTPSNPIGLKLASADPSENVIYIARPCQFTPLDAPLNHCDMRFWTGDRFAPEVLESYNQALNMIRSQYRNTGFNLIGYSGGANIAALLTESRNDIVSLRTVAGNLDNNLLTRIHEVSPMPNSLNARDEAIKTINIPQYHFVGSHDDVVPEEIVKSYMAAAGNYKCITAEIIVGPSHDEGWIELWPELLEKPLPCTE